MDGELNKIKKLYGENFAKLCRSLFPTILEEEGKLLDILQKNFAPTRSLYEDLVAEEKIQEFKYWVYHVAKVKAVEIVDIKEKPEKLMAKAGYTLYRCKTQKDIDKFKRFYLEDEKLCTFHDAKRIHTHHVFFAVKNGAEKLRRGNFEHPKREDEYGTSVISIQFDKSDNDLSIKNRYNHTVDNPDSTFYNDLENIIPGLTSSFAKYYGLVPHTDYSRYSLLELKNYTMDENGKRYRFNQKCSGMYFCENNVVIEYGEVTQYDRARYELVDCYLIDKSEKTIISLVDGDSFADGFKNIEKIDVEKVEGGGKKIIITQDGGKEAYITVNKNSAITVYENEHLEAIGGDFMRKNTQLQSLKLPNVKTVGNAFCYEAVDLNEINMPKVKSVGTWFLGENKALRTISFPELEDVGMAFLIYNKEINRVFLPKLKLVGDRFLGENKNLRSIELPSADQIGNDFLLHNENITDVTLPNVTDIGSGFMIYNQALSEITLPNVHSIGSQFLQRASKMRSAYFPKLVHVVADFMRDATNLEIFEAPNLGSVGNGMLMYNQKLKTFDCPNLRNVGNNFLESNEVLEKFNAPKINLIGDNFLYSNLKLKEISLPDLSMVQTGFLRKNEVLETIDLRKLKEVPYNIQVLIDRIKEKERE